MGRRNSHSLQQTLRRRGVSMLPSADEIVHTLRSTYPDYHRTKHQTLLGFVQQALQSTTTRNHDDNDDSIPFRKRRKKTDKGEEEGERFVPLTSSDSSLESDDEEARTASVSTAEPEPAFDLTKTMLRNSYAGTKIVMEENNVEFEGGEKEEKCGDDVEVKRKNGVIRSRDLGGMKELMDETMRKVYLPVRFPELTQFVGRPVSGILLHGPPGCGKSSFAHALANETGFSFYRISATEMVSGVSEASEENIRELFSKAYTTAPSIIFIDEIDAIASKRDSLMREMEKRIVTELLNCMDPKDKDRPYVLVIGATNRLDAIDPALRRTGRFECEILIGMPDVSAREEILSVLTQKLKLEGSVDLRKIARCTPGFVGADLADLAKVAGYLVVQRITDERNCELSQDQMSEDTEYWWKKPGWEKPLEVDNNAIKMADFEAIKLVQPSTIREGFTTLPDVKWEDIGGLDSIKQTFEDYLIRPIQDPEDYEKLGLEGTGFLLYGPPGCGKTLIAKAVANAAGASFIHINVDALTTKRGKEGGRVIEGVVTQLLTELDGSGPRRGVFVIGATNCPEVIDRALLRPGRLGKCVYVPLPSPEERVLILKALARKRSVDASLDLNAIGRMEACENMSGADLNALMFEAGMAARREKLAKTDSTCHELIIKTHQ